MDNNRFAPVLIPTLNRYIHLKRCIDSLLRCTHSDQTILVVGLDYPPSDNYKEGYEKIKNYLPTIRGFKEVVILEADHNIGVTANCNRLYEYVRGLGFDRYIFTEDDNEFAVNFLDYINWGLEEYIADDSIYAICGFKDINVDDISNNVYKLNCVFNAWGFGSWFNRLDKKNALCNHSLLKSIVDEASFLNLFTRKVFRYSSLIKQISGGVLYGDMLVSLLPNNEKWCIFPKVNKVRNWGQDGTGIHGGSIKAFKTYSTLSIDKKKYFVPVVVEDLYNAEVYRRFKRKYKRNSKAYLHAAFVFVLYKLTGCFPVRDNKKKWLRVKLLKVQ